MKRILKSLVIVSLAFSSLYSATHSKKTFLQPRAVGFNLPMELTTWHDHIFYTPTTLSKEDGGMWKSHFQITPFYQASVKSNDVGKYFGIGNGKNNFKIGERPGVEDVEVINQAFIHNQARNWNYAVNPYGDFYLDPKQEAFGVRLDFFQFLEHPFKKTFFKASVPFVRVENDPHFKIINYHADAFGNNLANYFAGKTLIGSTANPNKQDALTHAKIGERKSKAGFADVDLAFGYRVVEDPHKHFYVNLGITLPSGNRARGGYFFEPIYGNGHHFALGFGIDASVELWKKEKHSGRLLFALNHRYLFAGSQTRLIPIDSQQLPFGRYYLLGKVGAVAGSSLIPAPNVLTQDVSVRPGNQIDSMVALSFKSRKFLIDLGYNLFLKEGEALKLKKGWTDGIYGVADLGFTTANVFAVGNAIKMINSTDLNLNDAATPSMLTHKAFGSIGYKFHNGRYPSSFSIGASYEFAPDDHELEGYAFWGKFGMSF